MWLDLSWIMPAEDTSNLPDERQDKSPLRAPVVESSEAEMWAAELSFISACDSSVRSAQFAIRTVVRAQALAALAGTDPIDELLDARKGATGDLSRRVYESAINHLRVEKLLAAALRWPAR